MKLLRNQWGFLIPNWKRMSSLTLGVAVAVRAMKGTPGNFTLSVFSFL